MWTGDPDTTIRGSDVVAGGQFASKTAMRDFVGTTNVKLVYTVREGVRNIYYIDYSKDDPQPVKLPKPEGKDNYHADSPLFSPDGGWVTYYLVDQGGSDGSAYIQQLSPTSEAVEVASPGVDPHWWGSEGNLFIVYAETPDNFHKGELKAGDTSKGTTKAIRIAGSPSGPSFAQYRLEGSPIKLADQPYKGGLSLDGKYLCTGYEYSYFYEVE
jgi:hypothetical protein